MNRTLRRSALAAIAFALFFCSCLLANRIGRQDIGLRILWPGNAILIGMMMACGRTAADRAAIALAGALASVAFHLLVGKPLLLVLLFTAANVSEVLIAGALLRATGQAQGLFRRVSDVLTMVLAFAGAGLVSATIGTLAQMPVRHVPFGRTWVEWFSAAVLSDLVLAPMVAICARLIAGGRTKAIASRGLFEVAVLLGLTAAVACIAFARMSPPLLFLVTPIVLLVTLRLRAPGAAAAVAMVAVIAIFATAHGYGPIAASVRDPWTRAIVLQIFLAACFLTALPVAAILAQADARDEELRLLAERFRAVVENIGDVIFRIDARGNWIYLNPAWEAVTGHATVETMGRPWTDLIDEADRDELIDRLAPVLAGREKAMRRSVRFNTANGPRWMEIFIQTLLDAEGEPTGATGTLRDIDDRKRLEEHVMMAKRRAEQRAREATLLASTDELTGIANRRAFMQQLERELAGSIEFGWPLAVAMFDVDHFKSVNDRYGHAVGDRVLQLIAGRAGFAVRGGDLVGRLGGEEFGILMPGATAEDALAVAERLREAVETPREDQKGLPGVTVSIGVAERERLHDPRALLAAADAALYAAKEAGRNQVRMAA